LSASNKKNTACGNMAVSISGDDLYQLRLGPVKQGRTNSLEITE